MRSIWFWTVLVSMVAAGTHAAEPNPERNAYFGDLHVHTRYSFDAYIFNVRTGPNDVGWWSAVARLLHEHSIDASKTINVLAQRGPFRYVLL